ncbi:hypothetical protein Tco_0561412 [Tanacetum coccineum]
MGNYTLKQLRSYSYDEIKTLFKTTIREVQTFIPIESEVERVVPESSKRPTEEELDQQISKKQKTRESSKPRDKETDELLQEELQQMMIIVPEQGMNVEALQTKDDLVMLWSLVKEKFNSTERTDDREREIWVELKRLVHHVSTKDGVDIYMLVEREDPLSRGVLTQMLIAKLLVEQDN